MEVDRLEKIYQVNADAGRSQEYDALNCLNDLNAL